jgi:signal transduction histidine kinase
MDRTKEWFRLDAIRQKPADVRLPSGGNVNMQNLKKLTSIPQSRNQLAIILVLTAFYIVIIKPLVNITGPVAEALITIPVALAGLYFGINAGLIAWFASILLNLVLFSSFQGNSWLIWLTESWPGNLMVLAVGYLAGRIKKEIGERSRIGIKLDILERLVAILGFAAKDILDPRKADDKYYYLANHLANLFVADYAYITQWNAGLGHMTLLAATRPLEKPIPNIVLEPDEATVDSLFLKSNQVLLIDAGLDLPKVIDLATLTEFPLPADSAFALPLIAGEYKFGVVIFGFNMPRSFSSDEIIVAQLTGSQIALAIWTGEQDAQIKRRLMEADALTKIERALSETERVGIEKMLQLIVDSAKDLISDAEHVVLHMIDEERQLLVPRAVAGYSGRPTAKLNMRIGEGVAGQVAETGEVVAISDVQTDPHFLHQEPSVKYRSLIVAPIESNKKRVGTISIDSDRPNAFTLDDSRLLDTLGVQAAIAIENANLLETTREDLQEINALYHISQGLAATLDPDQLMRNITDLLRQNFGYYHVQVFVVDRPSGDLVVRHASGENASLFIEQGYRLEVGADIVGHVAEFGEPFLTNNVDNVVFFVRNPFLPDTQSELSVPIKIDNKVLGVLDIQEKPPRQFSQRQMKLMMAVADQFAVALQKANLYEELQSSLRQEKATRAQLIQSERLAVVGRLLASVSHELNNPLQAIQNALFLVKGDEKLSEQGQQDLDIILSETERMSSLISRLRATYRATQVEDFRDVWMNDVIEDVHALTSTYMRHKNISFNFQPDPELPNVLVIPDQIRQVVLNLFMNAIEAMQMGGKFTVHTQSLVEQNQVLITFSDTGTGISAAILSRIFEPFVTDKETGTGIGLTITRDIIHQHHGEILAENNPDMGATFKVWLPAKKDE